MTFKAIDVFGDNENFFSGLFSGQKTWSELERKKKKRARQKLIKAIRKCEPNLIVLAYCYSQFNDVQIMLRKSGILSEIIARKDLCLITGKMNVKLSDEQ